MRTNPLLAISAAVYALPGLALLFAPREILAASGAPASAVADWLAQVLGAALLGFAWINWLHRYTRTHGILGRTVLLPNLIFVTTAFWLALGAWRRDPEIRLFVWASIVLGALAVAFGSRLFAKSPEPAPDGMAEETGPR